VAEEAEKRTETIHAKNLGRVKRKKIRFPRKG
jgi:hypothetical protein